MATKSTTSPLNTPFYSTLEVQLARIALVMALVVQTPIFFEPITLTNQPTNYTDQIGYKENGLLLKSSLLQNIWP